MRFSETVRVKPLQHVEALPLQVHTAHNTDVQHTHTRPETLYTRARCVRTHAYTGDDNRNIITMRQTWRRHRRRPKKVSNALGFTCIIRVRVRVRPLVVLFDSSYSSCALLLLLLVFLLLPYARNGTLRFSPYSCRKPIVGEP